MTELIFKGGAIRRLGRLMRLICELTRDRAAGNVAIDAFENGGLY